MRNRDWNIRKKLLTAVLISSSLITAFIVGASIFFDYYQETSSLEKSVETIQKTQIKSISIALWNFSETSLKAELESILSYSEVSAVELVEEDTYEKIFLSEHEIKNRNDGYWREIPIYFTDPQSSNGLQKPQKLGTLRVRLASEEVFAKIVNKSGVYLMLQMFKTFLTSFFLLWVFQLLVGSKVETLTESLIKQTPLNLKNRKRIKVKTTFGSSDEFNTLSRAINRLTYKAALMNEQMENKVSETEELLKEEQQRLLNASKMATLGEMAAGIAHEINNPLTIMMARLDLLNKSIQQGTATDESISKGLEQVTKTSVRINKIVKGLKSFSRQADNDPFERVNLQEIISDSIELCTEKIRKSQIDLRIEKVPSIFIACRSSQISQVLINLINNAHDAILEKDNKWISVNCKINNLNQLEIRVTDCGHGIPKEVAEKMMQPFFTTKKVGVGTGLGLSISLRIISSHQGQIYVDHDAPHTTFVLILPLQQQQTVAA